MDKNIQKEKAWRNPNISSHAGIKCEGRDRIGSNVGAKALSLEIGVTIHCSCVRSHNNLKSADCFAGCVPNPSPEYVMCPIGH